MCRKSPVTIGFELSGSAEGKRCGPITPLTDDGRKIAEPAKEEGPSLS